LNTQEFVILRTSGAAVLRSGMFFDEILVSCLFLEAGGGKKAAEILHMVI
jgi:hypothetical protein